MAEPAAPERQPDTGAQQQVGARIDEGFFGDGPATASSTA